MTGSPASAIPDTMLAAVVRAPDDIRVERVPVPRPGPGEALVRVRAAGICSGDLMGWYLARKAPLVLGHEVAGEIVALGPGPAAAPRAGGPPFAVGDRVALHHHAPCFTCRACQRGEPVQCETWRRTRLDPGGIAEYVRVPRENLAGDTLRLPDGLSFDDGALVEPAACVVKSLRRGRLAPGDAVAVVGLGVMGLLHVRFAKAAGAAPVVGIDLDPARCAAARRLGADIAVQVPQEDAAAAIRAATGGRLADLVIVGPGSAEAILSGIALAGPAGRVVLFTPTPPGVRVAIDTNRIYFDEISLIPSYSCGPEETRAALDAIARGVVRAADVVTHRMPIARVEEAYRTMARGGAAIKSVIVFEE
ncbi:MAG TPA: alcohol dehydrogenase catalytic domain-containing protein [Thermodesulfobacteriota bacterium]|nr:alcohol dehydrogenase catalytic domain-containing protein [Thermodesulfobacteriota bacterium]